jgi:hypothetical protein
MSSTQNLGRFRANPVEVTIFLAATLILTNSVYELFYSPHEFHPLALATMHANPVSEGRSPSSTTVLNQTLNLDCKTLLAGTSEEITKASKVRLVGHFCTSQDAIHDNHETDKQPKLLVTNLANQFSATVFLDTTTDQFSTDYIPLNFGKNTLHLEFNESNGKPFSVEITANRTVTE